MILFHTSSLLESAVTMSLLSSCPGHFSSARPYKSQIFTQNSHFFDLVINLKKIRDAHLFIHFIRITGIYSNTVTLVIVISVSDLVPGMGEIDLKVKGL